LEPYIHKYQGSTMLWSSINITLHADRQVRTFVPSLTQPSLLPFRNLSHQFLLILSSIFKSIYLSPFLERLLPRESGSQRSNHKASQMALATDWNPSFRTSLHIPQTLNPVQWFVRQQLLWCGRLTLVKKDILLLHLSQSAIATYHPERGTTAWDWHTLGA
jgi:hypothetical protein